MQNSEQLIAILSIGFITLLVLLVINLQKVRQFQKEIELLKTKLNKKSQ